MKNALAILFICFSTSLTAQWGPNQILNPSFEIGATPTIGLLNGQLPTYATNWESGCDFPNGSPDVFDPFALDCINNPVVWGDPTSGSVKVPDNKWGNISASNGSRYIGLTHDEPLMGHLNSTLSAGCDYRLKFDFAVSSENSTNNSCGINGGSNPNINMIVEVRLRNSASPCSGSYLLYTTAGYNLTSWNNIVYNFTATSNMIGYDRIEFSSINIGLLTMPVYLDNISIEKSIVTTSIVGGGNTSICLGQSINLQSTGTGTWNSAPTDPSLNGQQSNSNITLTPTVTTTYTFSNSCSSSQITITVNELPILQNLGTDVIVCYAANYFIQAPCNSSYQYDWLQPPPANCTPSTGCVFNACNSGEYCVNVTNSNGCSASDCINIQFDNFPVVLNVTGTPEEICPDEHVSLLTSTPCIDCNFLWSPGGETTSSISVHPDVTTTYTLTASNSHGCHSSGSVTITVRSDCDFSFCRVIDDELTSSFKPNVGRAIASSSDGGIVIAGDMHESFSDADIYFAKYSPTFAQQNEYIVGDYTSGGQTNIVSESGYSVIEGPGGFYVAGSTPLGGGNTDVVVTRYDINNPHAPLWCFRYDFGGEEVARKIIDISVGQERRLMVVGYSNAHAAPYYDMFVMVINEDGTNPIVRFYGQTAKNEYAFDVIKLKDNSGYILVGDYRPSSQSDIMLVKINPIFGYVNDVRYGGNLYDAGRRVCEFNNKLYVSGYSNSFSSTYDVIISEVSTDLNTIIEHKIFGTTTADEYANDMFVSEDGHLHIAGTYTNTNGTSGFLLKVKASGLSYSLAKITDVHTPYANFLGLTQNKDHSISLIGNYQNNEGFKEIFLVKTLINYESCCLVPITMVRNPASPSANKTCPSFNGSTSPVPYGLIKDRGYESPICTKVLVEREMNSTGEIKNTSLVIKPNPNNGLFTIQLQDNISITEIKILDVSGRIAKIISNSSQTNSQLQIDASDIPNGIYFVELIDSNSQTYQSKIVVQK